MDYFRTKKVAKTCCGAAGQRQHPAWPAADPLTGFFPPVFGEAPKPARGPAAAQGGRPTKTKWHCPVAVLAIFVALSVTYAPTAAQKTPLAGTAELIQTLDRLHVLGSLLMIGAHPDDENTAVIAYFARGRHIRTAYLSATRGEGGQNLVGPEQNEALGLIRTQELLTARRIDGGEQFFTRAYDFGFSKNPEEALGKWGRERLLSDMVRVIRRFRPDVVVARFSPTGSGGHGHHTATGHLAPVAFAAAADPAQFLEQIREGLQAWRAKRLVWNTFAFTRQQEEAEAKQAGRLVIDAGRFDTVLGKSYAEIAGESRTQHASQGMGARERKGPSRHSFALVAGEPATGDLFEGIDTTWDRVPGAASVGKLLDQARREFRAEQPEKILPLLVDAYREMARVRDPWVEVKRGEVLHAIQLAAGLWLDADADRWNVVPGSAVTVTLQALNRSAFPFTWERAVVSGVASAAFPAQGRTLQSNSLEQVRGTVSVPAQAAYSQPYWLREPRTGDFYPVSDPAMIGLPESPPALEATFYLRAEGGVELPFHVPVRYRWVDRVAGEQLRPVEIVPPVSISLALPAVIFPEARSRAVVVRIASNAAAAKGTVALDAPAGWRVQPASAPFDLAEQGQQSSISFDVTPPSAAAGGAAMAKARMGDVSVTAGLVPIHYPHIPPQILFQPARARVERFDVRITAKNIGYVMGAGDEVPQALEQLGAAVRLLTAEDLSASDLSRFDAIVTGVRALNVRDDLIAARRRLLDYVAAGGALVVQYNTAGEPPTMAAVRGPARAAALAPYPLTPSNNRVSVEEAPVSFPSPDLPILHRPNEITARDFEGWVQERGLYFMNRWDERYQPVFACNDPGEPLQLGGTLYARYGKGVYVYTGFSWFRQLPAGVPGAYRIFANLVSGGK